MQRLQITSFMFQVESMDDIPTSIHEGQYGKSTQLVLSSGEFDRRHIFVCLGRVTSR